MLKIKETSINPEAQVTLYLLSSELPFQERAGKMIVGMKKSFKQKHSEILTLLTQINQKLEIQKNSLSHKSQEVFSIDSNLSDLDLQKYLNSTNVSWIKDSTAPGGKAILISGRVSMGIPYGTDKLPFIPIEDESFFYMECWIKNTSTEQTTHYMGSVDFDQNKIGLGGNPGSYGYWTMSNFMPGTKWTKVTGICVGCGTRVGTFKTNAKFWSPLALFNYSGGSACLISGWRAVKLDGNLF